MLVAESTMFITVATTLSVFKISPVKESGKYVTPVAEQTDGLIRYPPLVQFPAFSDNQFYSLLSVASHPVSFKCDIKPRCARAEALVRAAIESR